ncbi:hypothetical protein FACS1894111_01620 [Clostridia bacterium]|nr:hypothetical protein FACS1894111_01620 [Clostridia bacterium]
MEKSKKCVYCGTELPVSSQLYKRKYCSKSCKNKYRLRIKKPDVQTKLWQHESAVFERAMEMYWSGISSAAIARELDIPVGTMYSWVHDFGGQRERAKPILWFKEKSTHIWSLKERFRFAQNTEEWQRTLRESTLLNSEISDTQTVYLICGKIYGQSAGKLGAVIFESLKENPRNGKTYAFCNKCGNAITTISWNEPIYHIARYIKTHGTFLWPSEEIGKSIEITTSEFDHLISLQKSKRIAEKH